MRINLGAGKTEEIRLNAPKDDPPLKNAAGDAIGQVDIYKYLGTALGKSWREDFDRRRQLAWGVCSKYKRIRSARTGMDNKYKLTFQVKEIYFYYKKICLCLTFDYDHKSKSSNQPIFLISKTTSDCLAVPPLPHD